MVRGLPSAHLYGLQPLLCLAGAGGIYANVLTYNSGSPTPSSLVDMVHVRNKRKDTVMPTNIEPLRNSYRQFQINSSPNKIMHFYVFIEVQTVLL